MSNIKVRGIIIKQTDFGEANRILTIFTEEYGIIKATAFGAKSIKNKNAASSQFLCYADFVLSNTKKELMTVKSCDIIESFFSIHEDIVKLSLCVYFSDLLYHFINLNVPDENILRLFLNCVYVLCYRDISPETVKAVFELKIMSYAGFQPDISSCRGCRSSKDIVAFSVNMGGILCKNCASHDLIPIDSGSYHAIKYILDAPDNKLFSFKADENVLKTVSKISENYVLTYAEKDFPSLLYYKRMI